MGSEVMTIERLHDGRVYDSSRHDYHPWNDREYRKYLIQNHKAHREFERNSRNVQARYWTWRHAHPGPQDRADNHQINQRGGTGGMKVPAMLKANQGRIDCSRAKVQPLKFRTAGTAVWRLNSGGNSITIYEKQFQPATVVTTLQRWDKESRHNQKEIFNG